MSKSRFDGLLRWRSIGPYRGGRVVTVAGDVSDRNTFYFGACAGGVWKTTDGGNYWTNISDGYFNTAAVGALAVSESDPNVIYAGTGESTIRIDVSHGDGVYKSTDAGATWTHCGLSDTRFISKIRVHPTNPDIVFVAALGHAFGPNEERGVFKSVDGGQTWKKVLYKSDKAGAIDLSIDASNPRIMYAAVWEAFRKYWHFSSGGPDSGLWKSADGGETWTDITNNPGLPKDIWGKVGIATSPARAGRVWALIENKKGGMFRSDDAGATWEQVSDFPELLSRAWYYTHVTADPQDADTVWVNNLKLWKSSDGGRTYDQIGTPHGDNHDIWINPDDNSCMVQGNDGGANVSYNAGITWSSIYNQPTGQIYRMETDNQTPYRVYGTQQDNSSISVPSRTSYASITWTDCYLAGSAESGWIAPDPRDSDIVFVGAIGSSPGGGNSLQRYDHKRQQIRLVTTWPKAMAGRGDEDSKYRFSWTYPIMFSKHEAGKLYAGGNILFSTVDEGQSWQEISPDLSRNIAEHQTVSGGPINREIGSAETYNTIFSMDEDNFEKGVIWTGSDDGLIHITRDGGKNWQDVTPADMPEITMVHCIEASPFAAGAAYVAATRFKMDDYAPYLYKTTDYGKTWQRINNGIPDDDFTRIIRADPSREGLLYAGTETGLYISLDDGENWERFQLNLPVCPIYDLKVKERDLVAATHGRAFWILDDLTPLHQYDNSATQGVHLFQPREAIRVMPFVFEGAFKGAPGKNYMATLGLLTVFEEKLNDDGVIEKNFLDSGNNPPKGAILTYHLASAPEDGVQMTITDADGNTVRSLRSRNEDDKKEDGPYIPAQAGWNRFVWDLRYDKVGTINGKDAAAEIKVDGAMVAPGDYTVTLTAGDESQTQTVTVVPDPRANASAEDLKEQSALWRAITLKCDETVTAINRMRDMREQLAGWKKRLKGSDELDALGKEASELYDEVLEIESVLAAPDLRPGWTDSFNAGIRVYGQLSALPPVVALGDYKPTDQAYTVFKELSGEISDQLEAFDELMKGKVVAFNEKASAANISALMPA